MTTIRGAGAGFWSQTATAWAFLSPALFFYCVFLVYPMMESLWISLFKWDGMAATKAFVGLDNYRRVFFEDEVAQRALWNNLVWTLAALVFPTALGLALAMALDTKLKGVVVFRTIFYGPGVLPLVAVGLIWAWMYNPHFGAVNTVLKLMDMRHLTRGWLSRYETAFWATFITYLWSHVGFPMVLYLAGLQAIPKELYEAAEMDGAGAWRRFVHVTLPGLKEAHVIVLSLAVIHALKVFDLIYTMTYGGPGQSTQVLGTWMYFQSFQYYNAGYGAAIAWVISAIILVIAIPYIRHQTKN